MNLEAFDWSIGISDIVNYRECPQRFVFGMRRHVELPARLQLVANERDEPPESTNWTNVYGSSIHHAIHLVDKEGMSHERAIEAVMGEYGSYLDPGDLQQLREDLMVFERRRPTGVVQVASEQDMRVPLFVHDGEQVYFRFKLDVLHRLASNPSVFLHRDYKSTKWPKTPQEVHNDPQLWAYNWAIHERYPECRTLLQTWDGLRFGELQTTKNDEQRATMKQWLVANVKLILADDIYKPKINDFCRYCPLVLSCREPRRAAADTRGKLAVLAPLTKEGRKVAVEFAAEGEALERMIAEELPELVQTRKHIEHVEKALKALLVEMPTEKRERLGWELKDRRARKIASGGLHELHELMGDSFYELVNLPISRLEDLVGKPKRGQEPAPELKLARDWTLEEVSGTNVVPARSE